MDTKNNTQDGLILWLVRTDYDLILYKNKPVLRRTKPRYINEKPYEYYDTYDSNYFRIDINLFPEVTKENSPYPVTLKI
jgi:hypothetical protein